MNTPEITTLHPKVPQIVPVRGKQHIFIIFLLTLAFAGYIFFTQSLRSEAPDHGDFWSDMAILVAARNLNQYGYDRLCFAITKDNAQEVGLPPSFYVHHPSFSTLVAAVFDAAHLPVRIARLAPLLISSSGLIALYFLVVYVLGDWRVGLVAAIALGVSASFRLLSDSFSYQSYDFAAKTWGLLILSLAALSTGPRRWLWLGCAGLVAAATIGLIGFEMVPAIAAYSVLFPMLFASGTLRERLGRSLISGFVVGMGLIVGVLLRLPQSICALGSFDAVMTDMVGAFQYRTNTDYGGTMWNRAFIPELLYRTAVYYPTHVVLITIGIISGGITLLFGMRPHSRTFAWIGVIFICEIIWFTIFREHSHRHVHTVYHIFLTMSIAVGLTTIWLWDIIRINLVSRGIFLIIGVGLLWAAITNVGVQPYGNVQIWYDWSERRQQVDMIRAELPENAIVVLDLPGADPSVVFFLRHRFIDRLDALTLANQDARPWFLLSFANELSSTYQESVQTRDLRVQTREFALFSIPK